MLNKKANRQTQKAKNVLEDLLKFVFSVFVGKRGGDVRQMTSNYEICIALDDACATALSELSQRTRRQIFVTPCVSLWRSMALDGDTPQVSLHSTVCPYG